MEMAKYILQIFRYNLNTVFSWGFHCPVAIENGLRFYVQGFLHKGAVEVLYDEGSDLFSIRTLDPQGNVKEEKKYIYLDCLVDMIDEMVERCPDYDNRVKKEYGLID